MKRVVSIVAIFLVFVLVSPLCFAESSELHQEIYEKSGVGELYDVLDDGTKELMDEAGIDEGVVLSQPKKLFSVLSDIFRKKLFGPVKSLASIAVVIILCKLAETFGGSDVSDTVSFGGAVACGLLAAVPLLNAARSAKLAVESASVFLLAAAPVYGVLMIASGIPTAGSSYSTLTLAAGNIIPIISSTVVFPLLNSFIALSLVSAVSPVKTDSLTKSLYGFLKWLLVLAVTLFSGFLSIQTALNTHIDAAVNKTAKLVTSAAVPIVGGAFGDAVAAIQNSVMIVKSGAGAFGILAAICIFAPPAIEMTIWVIVCSLGQITSDILDMPKISRFLEACVSAGKMILAVIAATCAVSVASAAVVLFAKGGT